MDAWTIYWILQLDRIGALLQVLSMLSLMATAGLLMAIFIEECEWPKRYVKWTATAGVIFGALYAFTPTTKTAAAMVIVPAIANNQTLKREAGELYSLAKEALRQAVTDESSEKK